MPESPSAMTCPRCGVRVGSSVWCHACGLNQRLAHGPSPLDSRAQGATDAATASAGPRRGLRTVVAVAGLALLAGSVAFLLVLQEDGESGREDVSSGSQVSDNSRSDRASSPENSTEPELDDNEIRPGEGIGPIGLGETKATIDERLGTAQPYEGSTDTITYNTPNGAINVTFGATDGSLSIADLPPEEVSANLISTRSDDFEYDGLSPASGFKAVASELREPEWEYADCDDDYPAGDRVGRIDQIGSDYISTIWAFFPTSGSVQMRADVGSATLELSCTEAVD